MYKKILPIIILSTGMTSNAYATDVNAEKNELQVILAPNAATCEEDCIQDADDPKEFDICIKRCPSL